MAIRIAPYGFASGISARRQGQPCARSVPPNLFDAKIILLAQDLLERIPTSIAVFIAKHE